MSSDKTEQPKPVIAEVAVIVQVAGQVAEQFVAYRHEIHKYKAVLQLCPLPVMLTHDDGELVLYVNPAYTFFLGGTLASVQNRAWLKHWCADDRERIEIFWRNLIAYKTTSSVSGRYVFPPSGGLKNARITATVLEGNGIISFIFPEVCWDVPLPVQIITPQMLPGTATPTS